MKKGAVCEQLATATYSPDSPISCRSVHFFGLLVQRMGGTRIYLNPPLDDLASSQVLSGFKGSAFVTVLAQLDKIIAFYTLTKPLTTVM